MLPVLAVNGLAKEARLAAGPGVAAIGAGGDPQRLRTLLETRDPPACRAVVSIGIAGGLAPDLAAGDVVIASEIVAGERRHPADPALVEVLMTRLADLGGFARRATVAGVEAAVLTVADKASLHARTGAAAVDMESHVAADFAARHGLPFAALRVVCDSADRAIPAFAAQALKPNGEPDIVAVLTALLRDPRRIGPLMHLARDSGRAFATLTRCRPLLGPGLGVP